MVPSSLFFDLVDAGLAFTVTCQNIQYKVPRASRGKLHLRCGTESIESDATSVHSRLNALIAEEDRMGGYLLSNEFAPSLDQGAVYRFVVEPEGAHGRSASFPARIEIEAIILASDDHLVRHRTAVVEVSTGRKPVLLQMILADENNFVEVGRLSRRALHRNCHALIAAAGCSWTGSPDPRISFADMYGEDALQTADAEVREAYEAFMGALRQARSGEVS